MRILETCRRFAAAAAAVAAVLPLAAIAEANPARATTVPVPADQVVLPRPAAVVYDATRDMLWASVGPDGSAYSSTVVPIDASTGALGAPIPVGYGAGTLAISDDGQFLYVALTSNAFTEIRRVTLATRTPDLQWMLPPNVECAARGVSDLVVLPGDPHALAVAEAFPGQCNTDRAVAIYDDGVVRPDTVSAGNANWLIEPSVSDPTLLFANEWTSGGGVLRRLRIGPTGVAIEREAAYPVLPDDRSSTPGLVVSGSVLLDGINVFDAADLSVQRRFEHTGVQSVASVVADPGAGQAYVATVLDAYPTDGRRSAIAVFDTTTGLLRSTSSLGPASGERYVSILRMVAAGSGRVAITWPSSTEVLALADLPGALGEYTALDPERVLDTRTGLGRDGVVSPLGPGGTLEVQIAGRAGVPASGVDSVVVNATAAAPTEQSYLTVWPSATTMPEVSNLNYGRGATRANLVTVALGAGGRISLFNETGSVHVILDVVGFYSSWDGTAGARFLPVEPTRLLDTRSGLGAVPASPVAGGSTLAFDTLQTISQKSNIAAVALNITAVGATASSFVTVWPSDVGQPNASNLNFVAGSTVPNLAIVRVPPSGVINIFNESGAVHLLADVVGYYVKTRSGDAGRYISWAPERLLDTRTDGILPPPGDLWPNDEVVYDLAPGPYGAYVLNVTATESTGAGYITAYPWSGSSTRPPEASSLNYADGSTVPNAVIVNANPGFAFRNRDGRTHLIADVFGGFIKWA